MTIISGRCLCEKVVYEVSGELGPVYNCHCSKCRRWHGAAFRTRASISKHQFSWKLGADNLSSYNSSENVTKYFCTTCGSPLISTYVDNPDVLGIPLGGLEGEISARPQANIFTKHKASWYEISDGLPQYPEWPGSEAQVRVTSNKN